jgi:hypothetical protein
MFSEAAFVAESYGGLATERIAAVGGNIGIYEVRKYQLILGYDVVPKFIELYCSGLQSKLEASKGAGSRFCSLLHSEVGMVNQVMEIWRHDAVDAMVKSRVLSRQSQLWSKAVANIAPLAHSFTNTVYAPTPLSKWC